MFVRPAGKVSSRLTIPVVGPVPPLLAVKVQLIVSPTLTFALSAVFLTVTLGLVTVLLVVQLAGARQSGLSGPDGTTLLANVPAIAGCAVTVTLADVPPARPAGTVQVSTLPAGAAQVAGATGVITSAVRLAGKVSTSTTGALVAPLPLLLTFKVQPKVPPRFTLFLSTDLLTATFGLVTVELVWQSLAWLQTGLSGPDGNTLLAKVPAMVGCAVTLTLAEAPLARPAGTVQVSTLPTGAVQVAGATGVITRPVRLAGKVSVSNTVAVVAPLPLLFTVKVQCRVPPRFTLLLSTVLVTATRGLVTVELVWQSFACRQSGLSGPEGSTLLTKVPATVGCAVTAILAEAPPPARPAGTVHVRILPTTAAQVAGATGVTTTPVKLAGKVSVRTTAAVVGPLPVLLTVKVQPRLPPRFTLLLSTILFTTTFGLVTVDIAWQSLACKQSGLSGPDGNRLLLMVPPAVGRAVMVTVAVAPGARPVGTVQVSTLPTGAAHKVGASGTTTRSASPAGKVSVRITGALVAPLPLLLAVRVQLRLPPRFTLPLSTVLLTATFGLVMVVVAWQSAAVAQAGLSGPDGSTRLARLPPCVAYAVTVKVRTPVIAASWPAAMVQLCVLDACQLASAGHVMPVAVTDVTTRLAGRISARVTTPWLAMLPVLRAMMVQVIRSPTFAVALSATLVTRIFGPGTVTMAVFGISLTTSTEVVAMVLLTVDTFVTGCV